ncbi:MAG: O-antigen ligase family protein [Alphaproteobacteria bacterium]|nr:O-antigen ligase family protein [Alphaproteobacteria bacterium]
MTPVFTIAARPAPLPVLQVSGTARFYCLLAAVGFYALLGFPTPDNPGTTEIIIAALLLLAAGTPSIYSAFRAQGARQPAWKGCARLLLYYGFTVSVIASAAYGNDFRLVMRDLIPFLFFLLPLFAADIFQGQFPRVKIYVAALILTGFMFALRALAEAHAFGLDLPVATQGLSYFANAPVVLLAAILPAGYAGRKFIKDPAGKNFLLLALAVAVALVPVLAMAWTLQRASLAYVLFSVLLLFLIDFRRYPLRAAFLLSFAVLLSLPFFSYADEVLQHLSRKTEVYGLNKRELEAAAAWNEITRSPLSFLFGTGWGGTFESPAVAGIRVNYTHSLLTAMLLKTGIMGLALTVLYLWQLFRAFMTQARYDAVLLLAVSGPFLIDVFLYASYKSLDFGFLLLLMAAVSISCNRTVAVA